jgi:hypothetical protein
LSKRTVELHAGQDHVLLPEGLFRIDRTERPAVAGWYVVEYDPLDQFVAITARPGPCPACGCLVEPDLEACSRCAVPLDS